MLKLKIGPREMKVVFNYQKDEVTTARVTVDGVGEFVGVARRRPGEMVKYRLGRKVALKRAFQWMGLTREQRREAWEQVWQQMRHT